MIPLLIGLLIAALPHEVLPPGVSPLNAPTNRSGVITATGSYTESASDARIRDFELVRTNNSNDDRSSVLGPGWTHNFAIRLVDPGDGTGVVVLVGPRGRSDRYQRAADGSFVPPPAVTAQLVQNPDVSFSVLQRDQSRMEFDANGRVTALLDRFGGGLHFMYDESNRLIRVESSLSQAFDFVYDDSTGRLQEVDVALDDGGDQPAATYSYDTVGRLISVTRASGAMTRYSYVGDSSRLAQSVDPNGNAVVTNAYDDMGRVVSQKDAIGVETTYAYTTAPSGGAVVVTTGPTTSADSSWHLQTEETFDGHGWLVQRVIKPSRNPAEWQDQRISYDANGFGP